MADVQDPLFFAEEFAARRRRYIQVNSQIGLIAQRPEYKDYTFPFITGVSTPGGESRYPLLFEQARRTEFRPDPTYRPSTRFEAMSHQMYQTAIATNGGLEATRNLFVDSLLDTNLIADLSAIRAIPTAPVGTTSEFDTPPAPAVGAAPPVAGATGIAASRTVFIQEARSLDSNNLQRYLLITARFLSRDVFTVPRRTPPVVVLNLFYFAILISSTALFRDSLRAWQAATRARGEPATNLLARFADRLDADIRQLRAEVANALPPGRPINPQLFLLTNVIANQLAVVSVASLNRHNAAALAAGGPPNDPAVIAAVDGDMAVELARLFPLYAAGRAAPAGTPPVLIDAATGMVIEVGQGRPLPPIAGLPQLVARLQDITATLEFIWGQVDLTPPVIPDYRSHGYLSVDFVNYLGGLLRDATVAPLPAVTTICNDVLFKNQPLATPAASVFVDMEAFTLAIATRQFGRPADLEYASRVGLGNTTGAAVAGAFTCRATTAFATYPDFPLKVRTNAHTIEEAFNVLKNFTGTPLERYLQFVRFVYLFFDHIPTAQPVVSALLSPLVGMMGGIIQRGSQQWTEQLELLIQQPLPVGFLRRNSIRTAGLELQRISPVIEDFTTFSQQTDVLNSTSRPEAARAVIEMYRNHRSSRTAIRSLLRSGTVNPGEGILEIGYLAPATDDAQVLADLLAVPIEARGPRPLSNLAQIYNRAGIVEFDLPSIGGAHLLLPSVLGIPSADVHSMIYELASRWFESAADYGNMILRIASAAADYNLYSQGRMAYTVAGLGALAPPVGDSFVRIVPFPIIPAAPVGLPASVVPGFWQGWQDPPKNESTRTPYYSLPRSWAELLYPAYVSYALVEPANLREIGTTLVRPVLQTLNSSTVFPSMSELTGGYVSSQGADVDADPELLAALFEFPADVVNIGLPVGTVVGPPSLLAIQYYPGAPDPAAGPGVNTYAITRRTGSGRAEGIRHHLVNALSIRQAVPPLTAGVTSTITGWSTLPLTGDSTVFSGVPLITGRTRYVWTSLGFGASDPSRITTVPRAPIGVPAMAFADPISGEPVFLPVLDIEVFLSSFFDWRLQLYYLVALRKFIRGRDAFTAEATKIDNAIAGLDPAVVSSINEGTRDESAVAAYLRANIVMNLVSGSVPYTGFRNLLFNVVGPTAPGRLSQILLMKELITSFDLTADTRRFYVTQGVTPPRGVLTYDIDIDGYLDLLQARRAAIVPLTETRPEVNTRQKEEQETRRERDVAELLAKSAARLRDPYSILVDEIVTRALYAT